MSTNPTSNPGRDRWGQWVRATRQARGLSQRQLAHRAGVTRPTVQAWERGTFPAANLVRPIARALRVHFDAVLDAMEDPDEAPPPRHPQLRPKQAQLAFVVPVSL